MTKILYLLTSENESTSLRLGRKIFSNKEIIFNSPEEAIHFIKVEHPHVVVLDDPDDCETIWESINKINFTQPVKSISFTSNKVPVTIYSLLLHLN